MVAIGALIALCNALIGAIFPIPRIVYSMAMDGVVYKKLSVVNPKTKTPIYSTIFCGGLAAIMALIFDLEQLIDMMSIGTLLAYTIVAASVLILRYRDDDNYNMEITETRPQIIRQLFNLNFNKRANSLSSRVTVWGITVFGLLSIIFCIMIAHFDVGNIPLLCAFIVVVICMILTILIIGRQPVADTKLSFKTPLVPLLPCMSILINLLLMFQLDYGTWARLLAWLIIGYVIYFTYGIKHSTENKKENTVNGGDSTFVISMKNNQSMALDERNKSSYDF